MASSDRQLRIGVAGIAIESSTFSPHRTGLADFRIKRGTEVPASYPFLDPHVDWVGLLHARSMPGGPVLTEVYEALRDELIERLRDAGPLDGVYLPIHGAMSVLGMTDAEADLIGRIRTVVGPDVLISASFDLHGNISRELVEHLDLVAAYRMAPHEDAMQTRERAAANLVQRLREGTGRPHAAWVQVPVVLPGEQTSTRIEPARSLYARVKEVEKLDGVLDSAMLVGYPWADEPRCRAAIVVTGDSQDTIMAEAADLAQRYWAARREFHFVAPTGSIAECVTAALASDRRPYFISDSGDNPTAGGAGDSSYVLRYLTGVEEIMSGRRTAICSGIADAAAVEACQAGGTVTVDVGGKVDSSASGPVHLTGEVTYHSPDRAVIRTGGLSVIVTSRRATFHRIKSFTDLGLDPAEHDLTIVKIGYLEPDLYDAAADWMLALTPGGVDQDLLRVGHRHLARPLFPFDPDMPDPDLTPTLIR